VSGLKNWALTRPERSPQTPDWTATNDIAGWRVTHVERPELPSPQPHPTPQNCSPSIWLDITGNLGVPSAIIQYRNTVHVLFAAVSLGPSLSILSHHAILLSEVANCQVPCQPPRRVPAAEMRGTNASCHPDIMLMGPAHLEDCTMQGNKLQVTPRWTVTFGAYYAYADCKADKETKLFC